MQEPNTDSEACTVLAAASRRIMLSASLVPGRSREGDARAEYGVGYMYDTGTGVRQDFSEALVGTKRRLTRITAKSMCPCCYVLRRSRREAGLDNGCFIVSACRENGLPRLNTIWVTCITTGRD